MHNWFHVLEGNEPWFGGSIPPDESDSIDSSQFDSVREFRASLTDAFAQQAFDPVTQNGSLGISFGDDRREPEFCFSCRQGTTRVFAGEIYYCTAIARAEPPTRSEQFVKSRFPLQRDCFGLRRFGFVSYQIRYILSINLRTYRRGAMRRNFGQNDNTLTSSRAGEQFMLSFFRR